MKNLNKIFITFILVILISNNFMLYEDSFLKINKILAGEQLGQTNFDDGNSLPWHICESGTGKMDYSINNGAFEITIVNPGGKSNGGEDRWDCQFRHRDLKIVAGHQYKIEYEITSSNSGQYYTKIGNLEGDVEVWHSNSGPNDFDSNWGLIPLESGKTKKVSMTFTTDKNLDVAEWNFHLGGDGEYTKGICFPAGTKITFDNMSLYDMSGDENDYVNHSEFKKLQIFTNQLGYFPLSIKKATLLSSSTQPVDYEIFNSENISVYIGKSIPMGFDKDSGDEVHIIDFSSFNIEGTGYYIKANSAQSLQFDIKKDLYSQMLYDSLNYFYQNRSGIDVKSEHISSGDKTKLARKAGHLPDVCSTDLVWGYTDSYNLDVTGGWYDAGDYGKYVVNGGIALWTMLNQYEHALSLGKTNSSLYSDGSSNIPESGNQFPDILDESRYEMEFMLKMIVPEGKKYAGMVHHKVHDAEWTALGIAPSDSTGKRIIKPPSTAATLNLSACAAASYRVWKEYDLDFAKKCLSSAEKAYGEAKKNSTMFAPFENSTGGGPYGDNYVNDEFYWAATELFLSTQDQKYYDDMKNSVHFLEMPTTLNKGEEIDSISSFNWANTSALGTLSLSVVKNGIKEDDLLKANENIINASNFYLDIINSQGYGVPLKSCTVDTDKGKVSGYPWGSNSFVVNSAIVMAYAYDITKEEKHLNGLINSMDYLLGRNPLGYSYITGYGKNFSKNPHHRWWASQINPSFPSAPSGVLVGGPNSGLQDPYVKSLGLSSKVLLPQRCYVDHIESWSTNECTINWNAPLAWVAGYLTNISVVNNGKIENAEDASTTEKTSISISTNKETNTKSENIEEENSTPNSNSKLFDILLIIGIIIIVLFLIIGFVNFVKNSVK